jgi:hypothetical protein
MNAASLHPQLFINGRDQATMKGPITGCFVPIAPATGVRGRVVVGTRRDHFKFFARV